MINRKMLIALIVLSSFGLCTIIYGVDLSYPYGGTEFDSKMSDHKMIAATIPFMNNKGFVQIISYNTWARGTRNGFMYLINEGYGPREEPNADQRIKENMNRITQGIANNADTIFAVQEWSDNDLQYMEKEILTKKLSFLCAKTKGERFNNCFVYNPLNFEIVYNSTDDIQSFNNLKWENEREENGLQKDRYLHAKFIHNSTHETLDVVNVHLKTESAPDDIAKALDNHVLIDCQGQGVCVTVGDFNADLSNIKLENSTALPSIDGHLWELKNSEAKTKTADAIVYMR
ncbi:MAG: hypothetical protein Q8K60_00695 [Parachlamydiaceae bacterium]|nr:hypothetical protein [Parachlamydiaceae bacterium]